MHKQGKRMRKIKAAQLLILLLKRKIQKNEDLGL